MQEVRGSSPLISNKKPASMPVFYLTETQCVSVRDFFLRRIHAPGQRHLLVITGVFFILKHTQQGNPLPERTRPHSEQVRRVRSKRRHGGRRQCAQAPVVRTQEVSERWEGFKSPHLQKKIRDSLKAIPYFFQTIAILTNCYRQHLPTHCASMRPGRSLPSCSLFL